MAQNPTGADSASAAELDDAVDAHVHIYPPPDHRYPLRAGVRQEQLPLPSFTPEELFAHTRPAGVRRIVLIQHSYYGYDNSYLLDMIERHPGVLAVVGMVDPADQPGQRVRQLAARGVRGLRLAGGSRKPDEWAGDESTTAAWRACGEAGVTVCPLVDPVFLPAIGQLCTKFPATRVAIDHLARIGAACPPQDSQIAELCALARHQNVYVKVSAFYALGAKRAPYLDLAPMIRRVFEAFGPHRLLWGSDAPYQVVKGHLYRDSIELLRSRLDFLTPADRRQILRDTASKLFFAEA